MTGYKQFWDCDKCQERYPYDVDAFTKWRPIETEEEDEVLWLCGECAAQETRRETKDE